MTALSAPSATGTPSIASPNSPISPITAVPDAVRVRIAGSDRTYEVRDVLRGMGLRWDPLPHAWHGSLPPTARTQIERELGLPVQLLRALDSYPSPGVQDPLVSPPAPPVSPPATRPRVRDGSRSRLESRVGLPGGDDDAPEAPRGRFTLADVTSGLPDDSREADERAAARRLADLRGRVKAARAAIARTPGAAEALLRDPSRAVWLCARFGITPEQLRHGVPAQASDAHSAARLSPDHPADWLAEIRACEGAVLPEGAHVVGRGQTTRGLQSGMASPPAAAQQVDLRPFNDPRVLRNDRLLFLFVGLACFVMAAVTGPVPLVLTASGAKGAFGYVGETTLLPIAATLGAFGAISVVLSYAQGTELAGSAQVDDSGLEFVYPSGRRRVYRWDDAALRLRFVDHVVLPGRPLEGQRQVVLWRPFTDRTAVPPEFLERVSERARSQGVIVTVRPGPAGLGTEIGFSRRPSSGSPTPANS